MSKGRDYAQPNRPTNRHQCGTRCAEILGTLYWHDHHTKLLEEGHVFDTIRPFTISPRRYRKLQARFRYLASIMESLPEETNARGNTILRDDRADEVLQKRAGSKSGGRGAERYVYDVELCPASDGWEQFDTHQDAPYFGVWINRRRRETFTYCEGDRTWVSCPTDESFKNEIADMEECYGPAPVTMIAVGQAEGGGWERTDYISDRPTSASL